MACGKRRKAHQEQNARPRPTLFRNFKIDFKIVKRINMTNLTNNLEFSHFAVGGTDCAAAERFGFQLHLSYLYQKENDGSFIFLKLPLSLTTTEQQMVFVWIMTPGFFSCCAYAMPYALILT
jgi:hypothetical protein